jgi:hypothetical protein
VRGRRGSCSAIAASIVALSARTSTASAIIFGGYVGLEPSRDHFHFSQGRTTSEGPPIAKPHGLAPAQGNGRGDELAGYVKSVSLRQVVAHGFDDKHLFAAGLDYLADRAGQLSVEFVKRSCVDDESRHFGAHGDKQVNVTEGRDQDTKLFHVHVGPSAKWAEVPSIQGN